MTVAATARTAGPFTGNGVTTAFPFTFKVFTTTDLVVTSTSVLGVQTTLTLTTHYTVTLNADQNASPGGTVNMVVAPATGVLTTITSAVPETQTLSLVQGAAFYPTTINDAFDRQTILTQDLAAIVARAPTVPIGDAATSLSIPNVAMRAGAILGFDTNGNTTVYETPLVSAWGAWGSALFGIVSGTVNAFAVTMALAPSLSDGMQVNVRTLGANTSTTPTLNFNGNGAATITKQGGQALLPSDLSGEAILRYVAAGNRWELLNPASTSTSASGGIGLFGVAARYVDSYTTSISPAPSLSDGMQINLRTDATGNTTTTPTLNLNSTGAIVITKLDGQILQYGDLSGEAILRYVAAGNRWELLNPASAQDDMFGIATGSPDAFSATVIPSPNYRYFDGMQVRLRSAGQNSSTTPTFNLNGTGARVVTRDGNLALLPGDISGEITLRYVAAGNRWELLNPVNPTATYTANMTAAFNSGISSLQATIAAEIQTVANYSAAIAVAPVTGLTLIINSSDGGVFYPVTGASPGTYTSNGGGYCGTVIVPTGGNGSSAWLRVTSNPTNILWFGADSTGTNDSTTMIQIALSLAPANLFFPPGTYKITAPIAMQNGTAMVGAGRYLSVIKQATANTSIIVVANNNEVCGFQFSGTGSVSTLGRQVIYGSPNGGSTYATNISVHDNYFDATISTSCVGGNNLTGWLVFNNLFKISANGEHGIYISKGSSDVRVFNNHIEKTTSNGQGCNGLNIKGSAYVFVYDNTITGAGWDGYGIVSSVYASNDFQIRGNHIYGLASGAVPIRIGSSCADTDMVIAQNTIEGGFFGIQTNAPNVLISSNKISGTTYRGIECNSDSSLNTNTNLMIQGNQVFNCGGGIRVYTAFDNTSILGNTCTYVSGNNGNGIEYNNGSAKGVISGNAVSGFTTNYAVSVAIPCDAGAPFTPNFTGLTINNGTGHVDQIGRYWVNGNVCTFEISLFTHGTATTASTANTTHFSPPIAQSDSSTQMYKGHGIAFDIQANPSGYGLGIVQQGFGSQEFYTPTWSATNDALIIRGSYELF